MRFCTRLLALALVIAASTLAAHADTYEFIVSNFDGYGSYATFYLPSNPTNITDDSNGIRFVEPSDVSIRYEPGAPVYPIPAGTINLFYASTPFDITEPMDIGFGGSYGLVVASGIQITPRNLYIACCVLFQGEGSTYLDPNASTPTFELGTFPLNIDLGSEGDVAASVTIVNATPEPSTFVLLGTGILGLAGIARRKFMQG